MEPLRKGKYVARLVNGADDLQRSQALRQLCFGAGQAAQTDSAAHEGDVFDAACSHILIEHQHTGALVASFRLRCLSGADIANSYSAQYYDLTTLQSFPGPMAEIGRFCIHPDWADPDILRLAWGGLAQIVDARGIRLLFGCSSFQGIEPAPYTDAFALLRQAHLAPQHWLPRVKSPNAYHFATALRAYIPDLRRAVQSMPPLLRTYLAMGGWVSDHAVIDHTMNTLHVFTGLEVAAIPATRARALRAVAGAA